MITDCGNGIEWISIGGYARTVHRVLENGFGLLVDYNGAGSTRIRAYGPDGACPVSAILPCEVPLDALGTYYAGLRQQ